MKRLSCRDLETLIAALGILYADSSLDSLPERTLTAVAQIVSCDIVSFDGFDVAAHYTQTQWHNNGEMLTPENLEIFTNVVHEHPLIPELVGKKRSDALKITDVVAQPDFEKTALYNEFFRRIGLNRQMGMALPAADDFMISCAVCRGGKDFSERERKMLNMIVPHLLAAIRGAYFISHLERRTARLEGIFEAAQNSVIVLSADGRVAFGSDAARMSLEKHFAGERFDENYLPESLRRWVAAQPNHFKKGADWQSPPAPFVVKTGDGELQINLTRNSRTRERLLLFTEKRNFSIESLAPLDLTKRETEILFWMVQDKTNFEIGILCGISSRTVKKHAENIYLKLGVGSRTAAVVKALEIL